PFRLRTEARRVGMDVVDRARRRRQLCRAVEFDDLNESVHQLKYAPPSTRSDWPVTKSASGEQKNATAPTMSLGNWSRWIRRAFSEISCSCSACTWIDSTHSDTRA